MCIEMFLISWLFIDFGQCMLSEISQYRSTGRWIHRTYCTSAVLTTIYILME